MSTMATACKKAGMDFPSYLNYEQECKDLSDKLILYMKSHPFSGTGAYILTSEAIRDAGIASQLEDEKKRTFVLYEAKQNGLEFREDGLFCRY